jgi:serine/threonine protein phosphatase PrpC
MGRFVSAGTSDVGSVRGNNEDRVYIDAERGIYLVVDGMGGQAAGEEAAEIAVETVRGRLERPTESAEQRVREAIALANNAIFEAASGNPEWHGMACVLTLALVQDGHAVVGHVGDSRAYQIRGGKIEKITRDHSPVGEREDAGELSEEAAMNHPRRNEVYRDVGSRPRTPDDEDFIDISNVPLPPDSALLLCSDGLSDVVPARRILQAVEENANDCEAAIKTLVRAAVADGKDNVSIVLLEGDKFAESIQASEAATPVVAAPVIEEASRPFAGRSAFFLYGLAIGLISWGGSAWLQPAKPAAAPKGRVIRVARSGGEYASVLEAVQSAGELDVIELAPGSYPEEVLMRNGLTIRAATSGTAHVMSLKADGIRDARVQGVVVGEAGIVIHSSSVRLEGIECDCEIRFDGVSTGALTGSAVTGSIVVRDSASPEIKRNYIDGDVDFRSTGALKLEANGITGELRVRAAPPAALLDLNVFRAGKKAIRVSHE